MTLRVNATNSLYLRCRGFTIIEILLVLVILSIIAVLAVPGFHPLYQRLVLKMTTRDISYLMQQAQTRAMASGREVRMVRDSASGALSLDQRIDDNSYVPVKGGLNRIVPVPSGITLSSEGFPVLFSPDGVMSRADISVCNTSECFLISTKEQRGSIKVSDWAVQ